MMDVCDIAAVWNGASLPVLVLEQQNGTYREIYRNQPAKSLLKEQLLTQTLLGYQGEDITAFVEAFTQRNLAVYGQVGERVYSVVPMRWNEYFVCTLQDVTEQHRRDEELVEAAQSANREKTLFLSEVSHDIRTPMHAIIGMTELAMARLKEPEGVGQYLEKIQTTSAHMMSLLNAVLDFSCIECGRIELHPEVVRTEELLRDILVVMTPQAEEKNQEFCYKADILNQEYIMADSVRLKQIFLNLLSNAVKYTPEGGRVEFAVEFRKMDANKLILHARVWDNGIGIAPEFMSHLFDPFQRAASAAALTTQGSGLGMAIVKKLLDLMEGSIAVESRRGIGSCFTVDIPLLAAAPQQKTAKDKLVPGDYDFSGKHLMLVDDNEMNREIVMAFLEDTHVRITQAENGRRAVELFEQSEVGTYDLILMDIRMPELNGLEATRRIRGLNRSDARCIPIIAASAEAFEEDVNSSMEAGMNAHISKPLDIRYTLPCLQQFFIS